MDFFFCFVLFCCFVLLLFFPLLFSSFFFLLFLKSTSFPCHHLHLFFFIFLALCVCHFFSVFLFLSLHFLSAMPRWKEWWETTLTRSPREGTSWKISMREQVHSVCVCVCVLRACVCVWEGGELGRQYRFLLVLAYLLGLIKWKEFLAFW